MTRKYEKISGIRIGDAKAKPSTPTHVPGMREGNKPGNYEDSPGHLPDGKSTARRSTGVNDDKRNPILPNMPNLSPA
jgi:hypothetical protein